jgi:hypothetical protein
MAEVKPMMVTVEAIAPHSNAGESYDVGDTYEVPEEAVDNLGHLGMAIRVDRVGRAKAKAKPAAKAAKTRRAGTHKK